MSPMKSSFTRTALRTRLKPRVPGAQDRREKNPAEAACTGTTLGGDRAFRRGPYQRDVFGEYAGLVARGRRFPCRETPRDLIRREREVHRARIHVDDDGVAFVDSRDRTADEGLRGDVGDHESVRRAAEPAVGDERNT